MLSSKGTRAAGAVLLALLLGCAKQDSPEQLVAQAKVFRQQGNTQAAVIQLKNALQKKADDGAARAMLGELYLEMGDPASAEKEIRRALDLGMDGKQLLPSLARALLAQNQHQKLLDETQSSAEALALLPLRGRAFLALNKYPEAKAAFELALGAQADNVEALTGMALYNFMRSNPEAGHRLLAQAVGSHPKDAAVWMFKGDVARLERKPDAALQAYREVLAIKPNDAGALLQQVYVYIDSKQYDAAEKALLAAKTAAPGNVLNWHAQAMLDYHRGRNVAANDALMKILRVAPEHMPSVLLAGAVQFALGSMPQAEHYLKKFLASNPKHAQARDMLAAVYVATSRPKDAVALLAPALEQGSDVQSLSLLGRGYMELLDFTRASAAFERATQLDPANAALHTSLGISKLSMGEQARGLSELQAATGLDGKATRSRVVLAATYLRLKQYDKALETVQAGLREQPNDATLRSLEGGAYMLKGELKLARASFERALVVQPDFFSALENLVSLDLHEHKPEAAKARLEDYLGRNKDSLETLYALARLAQGQGRQAEATRWLERASNEHPKDSDAALRLTRQYLAVGEKVKAMTVARNLQVLNPDQPQFLEALGAAQQANGDKAGALDTIGKLAQSRPASFATQMELASLNIDLGLDSAAVEALKKALALQPNSAPAMLLLAQVQQRRGNYDAALSQAMQLQQNSEHKAVAYVLQGDILQAKGQFAPAAAAYGHAWGDRPDPGLLVKLCEALRKAGKVKEADERLAAWRKAKPDDAIAAMYEGELYIAKKNYPMAIEAFQRLAAATPPNAAALNNLAWAYHLSGDARALATAEQAMKMAGDSPSVLDTVGWILTEQGQVARGLPILRKALERRPEAQDIRYHLAAAMLKSNDKEGARRELERVLAAKDTSQKEAAQALLRQL